MGKGGEEGQPGAGVEDKAEQGDVVLPKGGDGEGDGDGDGGEVQE